MAEIRWGLTDPVMESVEIDQDKQGLWIIKVKVHEKSNGSLGNKEVRAKLIDLGMFFDKDMAIETWNPAKSRKSDMRAEKTLIFETGRKEYPDRVKIVFEQA